MQTFLTNDWPFLVITAGLVLAAAINLGTLRVPNWLAFPLILGALIPSAG